MKISLKTPLFLFIVYIVFSLLIFIYGPRKYKDFEAFPVCTYLAIFLILFSVGYLAGTNRHLVEASGRFERYSESILRLVRVCIVINFVFVLWMAVSYALQSKLSFSLNMGQNYMNYHLERTGSDGFRATPQEVALLFLGFPRLVLMTLGIYYFRFLGAVYKWMLVIFLLLFIFIVVLNSGHQKMLGDIIIYGGSVAFIRICDISSRKRKYLVYLGIFCIAVTFVVLMFSQIQRYESIGIFNIEDMNTQLSDYNYYKEDHVIFKVFGERAGMGIAALLCGYLAGGYYGLYHCLQMPFVFTWGFSLFSPYSKIAEMLTGKEVLSNHYILRMENTLGIRGLAAWHTVFPYLAGDLTFGGVLFFFCLVAFAWGIAWKEILYYRNPVSILFFSMLNLGLLYVPANNQLLWGYDGNIMTCIMVAFWILRHKRYNIPGFQAMMVKKKDFCEIKNSGVKDSCSGI